MAGSTSHHCVDSGYMATKELIGKVAIVTGAGRNIGRAIALTLAEGGASILVNARRNRAEAEAVVREIEAAGGKAIAHIGDVADARAVQEMADAAVKQFGRIDILVNNAALRREKSFAEMDYRRMARDPRRHTRWNVSLREGLPSGAAAKRGGDHRQYRRPQRAYGCENRAHVVTAKAESSASPARSPMTSPTTASP